MFTTCIKSIGLIFDAICLFCISLFKFSFYIGETIIYAIIWMYAFIEGFLSVLFTLKERFSYYEEDIGEAADYVYDSTNYGFNEFIEALIDFIKHFNNFLFNTKLHSKLLANKTGSFLNQILITIRNSLVLITECILEVVIFIQKLIVNVLITFGYFTLYLMTVLRNGFITIVNDLMLLSSLLFFLSFILTLWLNRKRILPCIQAFVNCGYKIRTLIYNVRHLLSPASAIKTIWQSLNTSLSSSSVQLQPQCIICYVHSKCMVLLPCKHLCLCKACCYKIVLESRQKICPICRTHIDSYLRVYM